MRLVLDDEDDAPWLVTQAGAEVADLRRDALVGALEGLAEAGYRGAKPHLGALSPGCRLCAEGLWSCLFLNGVCEGRCFFCPGFREAVGAPPFAERMVFGSPQQYAAYVRRLGFRGVSFSGGEPFGTFALLIEHLRALRDELGDALYIWAYTNGRPATPERLGQAAAAGLDEIRFDIAAWGYDTGPVERAIGRVPRVTVEIPAIPEDAARLRRALERLAGAGGVDHVHLHGLMVMGDNAARLVKRGYTLTRGATPAVIESELSALETLAFVADEGLPLAIQYCGPAFKERWQGRVEDLRGATLFLAGDEGLTEAGCLRRLAVAARGADAEVLAQRLRESGVDASRWRVDAEAGEVRVHLEVLTRVELGAYPISVRYFRTVIGHGVGDGVDGALAHDTREAVADYCEATLAGGMTVGVRRIAVSTAIALATGEALALARGEVPERVAPWERIAAGLPSYAAPGRRPTRPAGT